MTRKVDDAGEILIGARKFKFGKGMLLSDLDGLSDAEASGLVVKDNVWPSPDYAEMIAAGRPPVLVALLKIVRDRLPRQPVIGHREHQDMTGAEIRRYYIEMLDAIRALAEGWTDERQAEGTSATLLSSLGWHDGGWRDPALKGKLGTVKIGRTSSPYHVTGRDCTKARGMIAAGFPEAPAQPAWQKGIKIRIDRDGTYFAIKAKKIVASGAKDEESLLEALRLDWEAKKTARKAGPAEPPRRPSGMNEERSGMPDHRAGRDVTPEEFIETFGFRGIQFGEAVPDVERQAVVNSAYDALKDLAEMLGVEDGAISLYGRLGAAFGARGQGQASAHYEPSLRVFNITRERGAGSLAHEWAHGYDDIIGELIVDGRNKGSTVYASSLSQFASAPEQLGRMWADVVQAMISRERSREEALDARTKSRDAYLASVEKHLEHRRIELEKDRPDRKYVRRIDVYLASVQREIGILDEVIALLAKPDASPPFGRTPSEFLRNADALCGKSGEYWKRRHELFARAFESVLFDAIEARGGKSPFLVHGVEGERYADAELYKGNPYPAGEERTRLSAIIPAMVAEGLRAISAQDAAPSMNQGPR